LQDIRGRNAGHKVRITMDIKLPRHIVYTYKRRGGWYPHWLGGWSRLGEYNGWLVVYETKEDVENEGPDDCEIVQVQLNFKLR